MITNFNELKTYSELITFSSYKDRLRYLKINTKVGEDTFGFDRYLNQKLYNSSEWKRIRDNVIIRDQGCDLGCEDMPIFDKIIVHHMNPLTPDDIKNRSDLILNPEYLICVSDVTHRSIHYGSDPVETILNKRTPNDTTPWKH